MVEEENNIARNRSFGYLKSGRITQSPSNIQGSLCVITLQELNMKHLLLLSFFFFSLSANAQTATKPNFGKFFTEVGDQVPAFSFETLDGEKMDIEDFKGKVVLLNFWATWCGPCIREFPELNKFAESQNDEEFVVLAMAREQNKETVKQFADENGYNFIFVSDLDKTVYSNFAEKSIPRNVVLDSNGKIIYQLLGYYPEKIKEMEKLIEKEVALLKK